MTRYRRTLIRTNGEKIDGGVGPADSTIAYREPSSLRYDHPSELALVSYETTFFDFREISDGTAFYKEVRR